MVIRDLPAKGSTDWYDHYTEVDTAARNVLSDVAATVTAAATLAGDTHTPVNASSGAITVTLPTPARKGQMVRVEKVDASANAVTISGTLRGSAGTVVMPWQYEVRTFVAESLTSWRVAGGNTPKAALDAAYAQKALAVTRTPRRLYAIAMGDSTTAGDMVDVDGHFVDTNGLAVHMEPRIARFGPRSWFTHACMLSGGRLVFLYNAARGMEQTPGMLARFAAEVLAYKPDVVFLGDARNDLSAIPEATTRTNIRSMIEQALAAGILPVITTCYPDNAAGTAVLIRRHNAWLKKIANEYRLPLSDKYAAVVDPASTTGAFLPANTSDGTHATYSGAILAARRVLKDIDNLLAGTPEWLPADRIQGGAQLLTNPLFTTVGGTSGLAQSWTFTGTATPTLTTDAAVLGQVQNVQWTTSGAGRLTQDVSTSAGFAVGDRLRWAGLVKTSGAAAGSLRWSLDFQFLGAPTYLPKALELATGLELDTDWRYFEVDAVVPSGAVTVRPGVQVASGVGTVSIAQQGLWNLTALGA